MNTVPVPASLTWQRVPAGLAWWRHKNPIFELVEHVYNASFKFFVITHMSIINIGYLSK